MSYERDPIGGGPAETIAAIQRASRGPAITSAPRSGIPGRGLSNVQGLDKKFVSKGQLVAFRYLPDLLQVGLLNPGSNGATGGYYAGAVVRKFVNQRLIGWLPETAESLKTQPVDGFNGKIPRPGGYDPNQDYIQVVAKGDAK